MCPDIDKITCEYRVWYVGDHVGVVCAMYVSSESRVPWAVITLCESLGYVEIACVMSASKSNICCMYMNKECVLFIVDQFGYCAVVVVVVRLPRHMEGNGVTPIFKSLQNCQFHHRRLESLGHFNVLYIYIILSTMVSKFFTLRLPFFTGSHFFVYISIFASTLCMRVMYLTSI